MVDISKVKQFIFFSILTLVTIYSVFFLKVEITQYRIFQQLWNFGHVILFIGISYFFYSKFINKLALPVFIEFLLIICGAVIIGYGIELIQTFTGRDKSNYDVLLDTIGSMIAFLLFSHRWLASKAPIKYSFLLIISISTLIALYPMYENIADSVSQREEFPVLFSNLNNNELTRFNNYNVDVELVRDKIDFKNKQLLKAYFKKSKYPTLNLKQINNNWSGFKSFSVSIFNPLESKSSVILRIHDKNHKQSGFQLKDRFSYRLNLLAGWNKIRINLSKIKNSPFGREMDMEHINGLMFFMVNVSESKILYFDKIELIK